MKRQKISKFHINYKKYLFLLIPIAAIIVYGQVASFKLTRFDDEHLLIRDYNFLSDIANFPKAFITDAFLSKNGGTFYRPLQNVTFMFESLSGKTVLWKYHLGNLILHILCSIILFFLLKKLNINEYFALGAALVYTVSPIFTNAVAWIPSRGDILLGLFSVLSLLFFLKYWDKGKLKFLLLYSFCFLLALFSKETAVLLPFFFLLYAFLNDKKKLNFKVIGINFIFCIIPIIIWFFLRSMAIKNLPADQIPKISNIIANWAFIPEILFKFILPVNLAEMPFYTTLPSFGGIILIIALLVLNFRNKAHNQNLFIFGILWFVLFCLPSMVYRPDFSAFAYDYLEHRSYLPLVGIIIAILAILPENWYKASMANIIKAFTVIILIFGIRSYLHAQDYRDALSFQNAAVESNPYSAMAYINRALTRSISGDINGAFEDYESAIKIYPKYPDAYVNRSSLRTKIGDKNGAISDLNEAISLALNLDINTEELYFNRGLLKADIGDIQGSFADYDEALRKRPIYPQVYFNKGILYSKLGDKDKYYLMLDSALLQKPDYAEVYNNLGIAKGEKGEYKNAENDFNLAIQYKSNFTDAYHNRANARYMLKDYSGACEDWKTASKLGDAVAKQMIEKYCK